MHTHTVQYMNPHLVPGHTGLSQWGFFAFERDGGESEKKKERERFQVKTVWRALVVSRYLMYLREKKENTAPTLLFFPFLSLLLMGNKIQLKG